MSDWVAGPKNEFKKRAGSAIEKLRSRGYGVRQRSQLRVVSSVETLYSVRGPDVCKNGLTLVELEELTESLMDKPVTRKKGGAR
jgi:hypothetical protein